MEDFVVITLGTGLGSGIFCGGRLYMVMTALQVKWGIYVLKLMVGYVIVETKVVWRLMHQQVE